MGFFLRPSVWLSLLKSHTENWVWGIIVVCFNGVRMFLTPTWATSTLNIINLRHTVLRNVLGYFSLLSFLSPFFYILKPELECNYDLDLASANVFIVTHKPSHLCCCKIDVFVELIALYYYLFAHLSSSTFDNSGCRKQCQLFVDYRKKNPHWV